MNTCVVCSTDYEAKRSTSLYCSAKCRKLAFQTKDENANTGTLIITTSKAVAEIQVCTLEHYYSNPEMYATRAHPERLNWGKPMSFEDMLAEKLVGNRVAIPGDFDYDGVCVEVDGVWKVAC